MKTVYKCEKQINAEIFFSKGKIIFTAAAEQADNLSWQELEQQKEQEKIQREKEKRLQEATLVIKKSYGKNAILKGTNYQEGATMRERNQQIGGHRA